MDDRVGNARNANSRILGYRQSSSKIDKPCLRTVDKLCLHVSAAACNFRSWQGLSAGFVYILAQFSAEFFADKVCLQDLSAFWPGFGGFSADKVCLQDLSVRVSCADKLCLQKLLTKFVCRVCLHFGPVFGGFSADKVCLQDLSAIFVCILARVGRIFCRQSLSAELSVRVSCADKLCLQKLQTNFVCRTCWQGLSAEPLQTNLVCMPTSSSATSTRWQTLSTVDKLCLQYDKLCLQRFSVRIWPGPGGWGVLEGGATAVMPTYGFALGRYFGCMARFVCILTRFVCIMTNLVYSMTRFVYTYDTYAKFVCIWKTLSTSWQSLLQQANFVMHLTSFVCITQINSVCHADDKVCHEVTHFFITPTNIVCVLYTVHCVLCTV